MIELTVDFARNREHADFCTEFMAELVDRPAARDVFFILGVIHQLQNLDILSQICKLDCMIIPCWWRLFDAGYRPSEPKKLKPWFIMAAQMDEDEYNQMMIWYERYLDRDFFERLTSKHVPI